MNTPSRVLILFSCLLLNGCGFPERAPQGKKNGGVRILPLGDSITQGSRAYNSYRRPLWHMLTNAGYRVDFVGSTRWNRLGPAPSPDFDLDHEGHWGWRADEVLAELPAWLDDIESPDIALIHLGTNDRFQQEPMDVTVEEVGQIIRLLQQVNPSITILVAEIIPVPWPELAFDTYNEALRSLRQYATPDSSIMLVDLYSGFDSPSMTYDGIHPNEAGERYMAEGWFAALEAVLDRAAANPR